MRARVGKRSTIIVLAVLFGLAVAGCLGARPTALDDARPGSGGHDGGVSDGGTGGGAGSPDARDSGGTGGGAGNPDARDSGGIGGAAGNPGVSDAGTGGAGLDAGAGDGLNTRDANPSDQVAVDRGSPPSDGFLSLCGDRTVDPGEECDDGNPTAGDGCSPLCQIEPGWACTGSPSRCTFVAVCGDGLLAVTETCDDGNTQSGDGCSANCQTVEPGYQCRAPGKPCVPLCGDGIITGGETCDDRNNLSGDGCSSTCHVEVGSSCTGTPSVCITAVCGNGVREAGEACDLGPLNGLFNGDGSGCSKTCTKEPICRGTTGSGATHACAPTCGNGNVEAGEQCDDGNTVSGDGCSATCQTEAGFTCSNVPTIDTQPCAQTGDTGLCFKLPVKYRDFKNESVTGGHPDFFFDGATVPNPVSITGVTGQAGAVSFNRRYCVPDAAGPALRNDSTARAWDIAQVNLDNNGRPAFNAARVGCNGVATLADCQFTDFSSNGDGGHVPGYTAATNSPILGLTYVSGANGNPMYQGCAPVVTSATTFGQWWQDGSYESDGTTAGQHAVGTLELAPVTASGSANLYRFSSAPNSVYGGFFPFDPPANNFPLYFTAAQLAQTGASSGSPTGLVFGGSPAGPGATTTTGAPWNEQLLCNLWPYWYSPYKSSGVTSFGGGANCKGDQYLFPPSVNFATEPNGDWVLGMQGWFHDSWFSVEARYLFAFNGPLDLQFYGDDDTFIFINGVLVIDLGGIHQSLPGKVHVNADGSATVQEGGSVYLPGETLPPNAAVGDVVPCTGGADPITGVPYNSTCATGTTCDCRQRTISVAALGLTTGNTYELAVFKRDGHPTESDLQLTLSGFTTIQTLCSSRCGDGVVTGDEECDCGTDPNSLPVGCSAPNTAGLYGGCTPQCTFGPYCGDDIVNGPEQCDLGKNNGSTGVNGCTLGCQNAPYCGNGILDPGEDCDLGAGVNGTSGSPCAADCTLAFQ